MAQDHSPLALPKNSLPPRRTATLRPPSDGAGGAPRQQVGRGRRCPKHGLAAGPDGHCVRCRNASDGSVPVGDESAGGGVPWVLIAAGVAALSATIWLSSWWNSEGPGYRPAEHKPTADSLLGPKAVP
jgi:hypothetical protein